MNSKGSHTLKGIILSSVASVVVGIIVNKVVVGESPNTVRKLLGTLIMFGATQMLTKYADRIGNTGLNGHQS